MGRIFDRPPQYLGSFVFWPIYMYCDERALGGGGVLWRSPDAHRVRRKKVVSKEKRKKFKAGRWSLIPWFKILTMFSEKQLEIWSLAEESGFKVDRWILKSELFKILIVIFLKPT